MPWWQFIIWNDDSGENVDKIGQHGLTIEDVEYVLMNPKRQVTSKSSGRPAVYGYTPDGDYIFVVYEEVDDVTIEPITAYIV
ncbi:MAG TPA: hypothetical protein VMM76_09525 [Pirellulaceae bacterium]|nr:hypothetical protein [Pirellulaceae bacterium]